jgi:hypothetical protein
VIVDDESMSTVGQVEPTPVAERVTGGRRALEYLGDDLPLGQLALDGATNSTRIGRQLRDGQRGDLVELDRFTRAGSERNGQRIERSYIREAGRIRQVADLRRQRRRGRLRRMLGTASTTTTTASSTTLGTAWVPRLPLAVPLFLF